MKALPDTEEKLYKILDFLLEYGYPYVFVERIQQSGFLKKLLNIHLNECFLNSRYIDDILITINQIDNELFWDDSFQTYFEDCVGQHDIFSELNSEFNTVSRDVNHTKMGPESLSNMSKVLDITPESSQIEFGIPGTKSKTNDINKYKKRLTGDRYAKSKGLYGQNILNYSKADISRRNGLFNGNIESSVIETKSTLGIKTSNISEKKSTDGSSKQGVFESTLNNITSQNTISANDETLLSEDFYCKGHHMAGHGPKSPQTQSHHMVGHGPKSPQTQSHHMVGHGPKSPQTQSHHMAGHGPKSPQTQSHHMVGHGPKSPQTQSHHMAGHGPKIPQTKSHHTVEHGFNSSEAKSHHTVEHRPDTVHEKSHHAVNHEIKRLLTKSHYTVEHGPKSPQKKSHHTLDHGSKSPKTKSHYSLDHGPKSPQTKSHYSLDHGSKSLQTKNHPVHQGTESFQMKDQNKNHLQPINQQANANNEMSNQCVYSILDDNTNIHSSISNDIPKDLIFDKWMHNVNLKKKPLISNEPNTYCNVLSTNYRISSKLPWRNRLVLWNSTLSRLIDRSIVSSVYLDQLTNNKITNESSSFDNNLNNESFVANREKCQKKEMYTPQKSPYINSNDHYYHQLISFHESVLWSIRLIYFITLFHTHAADFAKSIIDTYIYLSNNNPTENSPSGLNEVTPDGSSENQINELASDNPLAQFRFFENDIVYINTCPNKCIGGGMQGILVLGSHDTDISYACKVYGKEIEAQKNLTKAIIQLRLQYAKDRFDHYWSSNYDPEKHFGCFFSLKNWISNPFSILTPQLICSIDYKGFRVVVFPLYYRPPSRLVLSELLFGSRIHRELVDLNKITFNKIPYVLTKSNISSVSCTTHQSISQHFELLVLDKFLPFSVIMYKAFTSLIALSQNPSNNVDLQTIDLNLDKGLLVFHSPILDEFCNSNSEYSLKQSISINRYLIQPFPILVNQLKMYLQRNNANWVQYHDFSHFHPFIPLDIDFSNTYINILQHGLEDIDYVRIMKKYFNEILQNCVKSLESQPFHSPYDSASLNVWIRRNGLNCRFLGYLINMTSQEWIKQLILVEIVSRILKRFLENCLRAIVFSPSNNCVPIDQFSCTNKDFKSQYAKLYHSLPVPLDIAEYSRTEVLAFNTIRFILSTTSKSNLFWNSFLASYIEKEFGCHFSYIKLHKCPAMALISAYEYHTGIQFKTEMYRYIISENNKGSTLESHQQQQSQVQNMHHSCISGWYPIVKPSIDLENLWATLPGLSLLLFPHKIPLLPYFALNSNVTCLKDYKTCKNLVNDVANTTQSQEYLIFNLKLILYSVDNIIWMYEREKLLNILIKNQLTHVQSPIDECSSQNSCILFNKLLNDIQYLQKIKLSIDTKSCINSVKTRYDRTKLSYGYLYLACFFMKQDMWEISIRLLEEIIHLLPSNHINMVYTQCILYSCYAVHHNHSKPINKYIHFNIKFRNLLDSCITYWKNHHPMVTDILLFYAWSLFLLKEYTNSIMMCISAIHHIYYLLEFDNIPQHESRCIETFFSYHEDTKINQSLKNLMRINRTVKLGYIYRLLGTLCMTQASNYYYLLETDTFNTTRDFMSSSVDQFISYSIMALEFSLYILEGFFKGFAYLLKAKKNNDTDSHPYFNYFRKCCINSLSLPSTIDFIDYQIIQHLADTLQCQKKYFECFALLKYLLNRLFKVVFDHISYGEACIEGNNDYSNYFLKITYRPESVFSTLGWGFHDVHFWGIHDTLVNTNILNAINQNYSGISRIKNIQCYILKNWIVPDLSKLLITFVILYINYLMPSYQKKNLIKLYKKFYLFNYHYINSRNMDTLSLYYLKSINFMMSYNSSISQNYQTTHQSPNLLHHTDTEILLHCIRNHGTLLSKDHLLRYNLNDLHVFRDTLSKYKDTTFQELVTSNLFFQYPVLCLVYSDTYKIFNDLILKCDADFELYTLNIKNMMFQKKNLFCHEDKLNELNTIQMSTKSQNMSLVNNHNVSTFENNIVTHGSEILQFKSSCWDILCSILYHILLIDNNGLENSCISNYYSDDPKKNFFMLPDASMIRDLLENLK